MCKKKEDRKKGPGEKVVKISVGEKILEVTPRRPGRGMETIVIVIQCPWLKMPKMSRYKQQRNRTALCPTLLEEQ